jgi:hypothetical protein
VSADDRLEQAIGDWQRKHHIADGDPMIAALELVRIYLHQARPISDDANATPPSFEDFRSTVELLDRRSKSFINQSADLVTELRRFGQNVARLNRARAMTHLLLTALGAVAGVLIGRCL